MTELIKKMQEQIALAEEYGFEYVYVKINVSDAKYIVPAIKNVQFTGIGYPSTPLQK